jgi:cytochrome c-type biogenesis protein
MLDHLVGQLGSAMGQLSPLALLLALAGGTLTGLNPCSYPTIPVMIGLIGAQGAERPRWQAPALAATFVSGLALVYALLGLTFATVGQKLGLSSATWSYLAATVCLVFGLHWAGVLTLNFRAVVPFARYRPQAGSFAGALVLGALFGLVATPCATPILAVILSASAAAGQPLYGAVLLFAYAVGHGLPLLLLGTFAGIATRLKQVGQHMETVQKASGWVLVAVAFYLALTA